MTTQEMHIALDLLIQKINSNWNQNITPQEKDWFLNREITKFIKQRLKRLSNNKQEGAFDTVKRTEDLNALVKTRKIKVSYTNQKEVLAELPFDYLYYASSECSICCGCKDVQPKEEAYYVSKFKPLIGTGFSTVDPTLNSYTIDIMIGSTSFNLFNLGELPQDYFPSNANSIYNRFMLINAIKQEAIRKAGNNIEIRFNNSTRDFEIRTTIPHSSKISINGGITTLIGQAKKFIHFKKPTENGANLDVNSELPNITNIYKKEELRADVRLIDEEFANDVKRSYLSGSKDQSIISKLRNENLLLTPPKDAILHDLYLTYFCQPRQIDLHLDIHSELPDEVLDEVIGNAAQTIKGVLSSDTYDKYVRENMLTE